MWSRSNSKPRPIRLGRRLKDANVPPHDLPLWAKGAGVLVLPIITAIVTSLVTLRSAETAARTKITEVNAAASTKMIETAVQLLKDPPARERQEIRAWAAEVLERHGGVPLTPDAKKAMVTATLLSGQGPLQRLTDTPISRFVTDTMRAYARADIALLNAGAIRANDLPMGTITETDVDRILPFTNTVVAVRLTGAQVRALLDAGARGYGTGTGRLLQVSGLVYNIRPGGTDGERICEAYTIDASPSTAERQPRSRDRTYRHLGGLRELEDAKEYVVALNDYLLQYPADDLGPGAAEILRKAVVVIQPGESPVLSRLVLNALQRRGGSHSQIMGRISVGCL